MADETPSEKDETPSEKDETPSEKDETPSEEKEYFEIYSNYNTTLRAWFVGFGIGGPILILTNENLLMNLKVSGWLYVVGWLFIIGVGCQIAVAFINKHNNWLFYFGEVEESFQNRDIYKEAERVSKTIWIDITADLISIFSFYLASIIILYLLV